MPEQIVITQAMLRQWAADEERLLKEIATKQQELDAVKRKRAAVAVLEASIGPQPQGDRFELTPPVANGKKNGHARPANMMDALAELANASPVPLERDEIKRRLIEEAGIPKDKLGPYFYTVVMRLKQRKLITVLPDGKIWKAA